MLLQLQCESDVPPSIHRLLKQMTYRQLAVAGMMAIGLILTSMGWRLWCECTAVQRLIAGGVKLSFHPIPNVWVVQQVAPVNHLVGMTLASQVTFPPSMVVTDRHANDMAWLRSLQGVSITPPLYSDKYSVAPPQLADESVRRLGNLRRLTALSVMRSRLTNDGLKHVGELRNLTSLRIDSTLIDDDGLKHLGKMTKLQTLYVNCPQVKGPGLTALKQLPHLKELTLYCSQVNDDIIPTLVSLSNLKRLWIGATAISQAGRLEFIRQRPDFKNSNANPKLFRAP